MKTASHYTWTGPGRICISRGAPRGAPAGYKIFRSLAPTGDMMHMPYEQYRRKFFDEILGKLDPQQTWDALHELAGGAEPVIQCFERPPFSASNWCHRRMVAEWFEDKLGHKVDEIEPETKEQKAAHAAARQAAGNTGAGLARVSSGSTGPVVELVREAITRFKAMVERKYGVRFGAGSWIWMPDRIRADLDSTDDAEWSALMDRYRAVY